VLATLPFVPMVEMGVVVAVGVLLQTLLVAPAMLAPMVVGLRRWIWWPSHPTENPQPAAVPDESVLIGEERS
jgi:RND superfamily putative drug exporter